MDEELLKKAQVLKVKQCCEQITSLLMQLDKMGVRFTAYSFSDGTQVLAVYADIEKKQIMLLPF